MPRTDRCIHLVVKCVLFPLLRYKVYDYFVYLNYCIILSYYLHFCSKYNMADGMRQMFDPFERVARAHHICPCCERSFSPEEEEDFVRKVINSLFISLFLIMIFLYNSIQQIFSFNLIYFHHLFIAKSEKCKICRAHEVTCIRVFKCRLTFSAAG